MRLPLAAWILLPVVGVASLSVPASTAIAQTKAAVPTNTICKGTLPAGTYINVIAQSGSCAIGNNATISGSVTVQSASLTMANATVTGNVTSQASAMLNIGGSTIGGNVTLQAGVGPVMYNNSIGGNMTWQNETSFVYGVQNQVKGNIVIQNVPVGLFEFNSAGGSCGMQNSVVGVGNTAVGSNSCN
jgi:hypothetical protein